MSKKKNAFFISIFLAVVGLGFLFTRPVDVPINGLLRTDVGSQVKDGY